MCMPGHGPTTDPDDTGSAAEEAPAETVDPGEGYKNSPYNVGSWVTIKAGHLYKRRRGNEPWRKRWVVLQEGRILWTSDEDTAPKGASTIWYAKVSHSARQPMDSKAFHLAKIFGHKVKKIFKRSPHTPSIAEEPQREEQEVNTAAGASEASDVDIHAAAHAAFGNLTTKDREHYLEIAEVLSSKSAEDVDRFWEEVGKHAVSPEDHAVDRASFDILTASVLPDVDDENALSDLQRHSLALADPTATEWVIEGELWARREIDDMDSAFHLPGATHWKARYARLKGSLSCPFLIVYREGKWPTPVKQVILLHGSMVRASNKRTVRTRFRFTITTADGHSHDFGTNTNEERTLWIAKLEQVGVDVDTHFSLPAMAVVVLDELSARLMDSSSEVSAAHLHDLFKSFDHDSTGTLDALQLAEAITTIIGHEVTEVVMMKLFDVIDAQHDGAVDYAEFVECLEAYSQEGQASAAAVAADIMAPPASTASELPAPPAPVPAADQAVATDATPRAKSEAVGKLLVSHWHANGTPAADETDVEEEGPEILEHVTREKEDDALPEFAFPITIEFNQRDGKEHRRLLLAADGPEVQQEWVKAFQQAVVPQEDGKMNANTAKITSAFYTNEGPKANGGGALFFAGGQFAGEIKPHWEQS